MKIGLVALLLFSSVPVNAHESQTGYTTQRTCYKEIYREEYVARTRTSQGYVKSFAERVEVPCIRISRGHHPHPRSNYSRARYYYRPTTNYRVSRPSSSSSACQSSRATAGVLGGGLAAALSKKDAWSWSIPLGAVIGFGVGDTNC